MSSEEENYMPSLSNLSLKDRERYLISKSNKSQPFSQVYLINNDWWKKWSLYIEDKGEKPGAINNDCLLDEEGDLKKDLVEDEHFVVVDKESMQQLANM